VSVIGETAGRERPVRVRRTMRVNGRSAHRGRSGPGRGPVPPPRGTRAEARWQVRLDLSWDAATGEQAMLTVACDPPRAGVASGAWPVPLDAVERSLNAAVSAGSVHLAPEASGGAGRVWVEAEASVGGAARPWVVSVPRRWVRLFLDDVAAVREPARPLAVLS
jgi:hypothetical protein